MVNAAIEKDPPVEVAWCDVEDRGVRWLYAKASLRLGEGTRLDDLHVARDQASHKPSHEIGTVNEKQSCHRSTRRTMQGAYHDNRKSRRDESETRGHRSHAASDQRRMGDREKSNSQAVITLRPCTS